MAALFGCLSGQLGRVGGESRKPRGSPHQVFAYFWGCQFLGPDFPSVPSIFSLRCAVVGGGEPPIWVGLLSHGNSAGTSLDQVGDNFLGNILGVGTDSGVKTSGGGSGLCLDVGGSLFYLNFIYAPIYLFFNFFLFFFVFFYDG